MPGGSYITSFLSILNEDIFLKYTNTGTEKRLLKEYTLDQSIGSRRPLRWEP